MRGFIFSKIKERLESIDGIARVELFNSQLEYAEEEQAFATPAVLIEFQPIQWRHQLHGVREADITVVLHVVTDSRVGHWSDTIEVFSLLDSISSALHGIGGTAENGSVMNSLTLTSSTTDHNFDELQDNVETYTCHVTDRSAYK